MMDKVTIADCSFLQYQKAAFLGGENSKVKPTYFEWDLTNTQEARFVTDSFLKDAKGTGQVALLLESFFLHPENYITAMEKPFDYVLTSNRYFAENKGWIWYPHGGSWIDVNKWGMRKKDKNVSILLSDKKSMRGHSLRHEIVEKYGDRLDVFGLDHYSGKLEALAPYRYSVVVEPEQCLGLFSEHLIDCLSVGTIPIYWGCPDIKKYFDQYGLVAFKDLGDFGSCLEAITEMYREVPIVSQAIRDNIRLANKYRICEDWIYENYPFLFQE